MTATAETATDLGACGWCGCPQFNHRLGKKGCKDPECGCAKYEPPKGRPEPVEVPGVLVAGPDGPDLGVCVGGFEPAQPGDVDLPVEPGPTRVVATPAVERPVSLDGVKRRRRRPAADPAAQAEVQDLTDIVDAGLRPVAELMEAGRPEPTCAYPNGEDDGEHDHAMCEDVVAERDEAQPGVPEPTDHEVADEIDRAEIAAEIERLTTELTQVRAALGVDEHAGALEAIAAYGREIGRLNRVLAERAAELSRTQAQVDRLSGQLQARLADLDEERREYQATLRIQSDLSAEVLRLRGELDRANAGRQHALDQLDEAIRAGVSATANVLERQDRYRCDACGSRYGQPFTDHGCGPLTPVTVLIVAREVPGA